MTLYSATILAVFVAVWVIARVWGGPPERITGTVLLAWIATDFAYHRLFGPSGFSSVDPIHMLFDGSQLVAIAWIALRANRMWPLWATGASLVCFSGHLAVLIQPDGMNQAYWALSSIPQHIQLGALLVGVVAHARRRARLGRDYRSWRKP